MLFRSERLGRPETGNRNQPQTERPVPGRSRQGKGGLRVTGCSFGSSGARNLRVRGNVDRISDLLVNGLIDWISGDVARRLKITAHRATVAEIAKDVWHDGNSHRGRKPKRNLKEAEDLGRKWNAEKAASGTPHEHGPGSRPWTATQPNRKVWRIDQQSRIRPRLSRDRKSVV